MMIWIEQAPQFARWFDVRDGEKPVVRPYCLHADSLQSMLVSRFELALDLSGRGVLAVVNQD